MKRLGLVLAFLICFATADVFCMGNRDHFIPVTVELINQIQSEGQNIQNLAYYLTVPLTMEANRDKGREVRIDQRGRYVISEKTDSDELRIKTSEKGKYGLYSSEGKESFEVSFLNGRIGMTFQINDQGTGFDFVRAWDTRNDYEDRLANQIAGPIPQLGIYYKYTINNKNAVLDAQATPPREIPGPSQTTVPGNNVTENQLASSITNENNLLKSALETAISENDRLKAELAAATIPAPIPGTASTIPISTSVPAQTPIPAPANDTTTPNPTGATPTPPAPIPTPPLIPVSIPITPPTPVEMINAGRNIEGRGSLDKNVIVDYISLNNSAVPRRDVENLIEAYIREARLENINYDIAVAQMCYATNYLKSRQLVDTHNYGDFDAINGIPVMYAGVDEGVRAHIQHLKAYTSRVKPQGNIVDQRYYILGDILGTVKTLDALFRIWAPGDHQNYGNGINSILDDLYRFSAR